MELIYLKDSLLQGVWQLGVEVSGRREVRRAPLCWQKMELTYLKDSLL
jgi:hypothetical protein